MELRRAKSEDIEAVLELLREVCRVHAEIRPDLFQNGGAKYSAGELLKIFDDDMTPVFVCTDDTGVLGYAFCAAEEHDGSVSPRARKRGVATALFAHVKRYAAEEGFDSITLNVWEGNTAARSFYDKMGMKVRKTTLELKL